MVDCPDKDKASISSNFILIYYKTDIGEHSLKSKTFQIMTLTSNWGRWVWSPTPPYRHM